MNAERCPQCCLTLNNCTCKNEIRAFAGNRRDAECDLWFMIVRVYRGKRRVMSLHPTKPEAEMAFKQACADLRDGDILLVRGQLETLYIQSGGYNRTRW